MLAASAKTGHEKIKKLRLRPMQVTEKKGGYIWK